MASDPTSFNVTCRCGQVIHTNDGHIGRTIRCRCGHELTIERPAHEKEDSDKLFRSAPSSSTQPKRTRSSNAQRSRKRSRNVTLAALRQSFVSATSSFVSDFVSENRARRFATVVSVLILLGSILSWLLLAKMSEEFLPATLLAYGPRFALLIPIAAGALLSLCFARRSIVLHLLSAIVVLVPVMGARLNIFEGRGPIPSPANAGIRVLSLNADGGQVSQHYLPELLTRVRPDLVDVQECGDELSVRLAATQGYHFGRHANMCVLSRWPIAPVDSMPRAAFDRVSSLGYGGTGLVARYRVARPDRPLDFISLHLETPRKGLERLMGSDGFLPDGGGVPRAGDIEGEQINARIRRMESERASVWSARFSDAIPVIVAGDFNMPVESTIFRDFWTRFDDSFEQAGLGFGYTKFENRYIRARIDHILFASKWLEATGAWVGPDVGSDHRPVIADLRFR